MNEVAQENLSLHQVTQETSSVLEEKLQLASTLAQLQAENESLLKENEYYKDDLVPTMREKNKEMQRKFREFDAERKALIEENASIKQGTKSDSEQLDRLRGAHAEAVAKQESQEAQLATLRKRFNEQVDLVGRCTD